jgi:hypothetical protein
MSDAGSDAQCPVDGGKAVRVFTMPATNFNRPTSASKPAASTAYSHYGHTHGAGAAPHSHGPGRRPRRGAI